MSKQNASVFKLYVVETTGGPTPVETEKLITEQTSLDISRSTNTIDVTSKDNNGFEEFIGGLKSGEASLEYIVDFDLTAQPNKVNHLEMSGYEMARLVKRFRAKLTSTTGKMYSMSFDGLITKFDTKAPMEDKITCSVTIKRSGAPVEAVA